MPPEKKGRAMDLVQQLLKDGVNWGLLKPIRFITCYKW